MKQDLLWETWCIEKYGEPTPVLTDPERGRINKQLKHLRKIEATPEQLKAKCGLYRKLHPTWEFTLPAVVVHWNSLVVKKIQPRLNTYKHPEPIPREVSRQGFEDMLKSLPGNIRRAK